MQESCCSRLKLLAANSAKTKFTDFRRLSAVVLIIEPAFVCALPVIAINTPTESTARAPTNPRTGFFLLRQIRRKTKRWITARCLEIERKLLWLIVQRVFSFFVSRAESASSTTDRVVQVNWCFLWTFQWIDNCGNLRNFYVLSGASIN